MLEVGLTGNIGSGKTVISHMFSILGIPVYHADDESKKFLDDPGVKNEILKHFGYGILLNDGEINKRSLASLVFTNEKALRLLNSILHPKVMQGFKQWVAMQPGKAYVIMEAAIIFESGLQDGFDRMIHVSCSRQIAIERVSKRDAVAVEDVMDRLNFQWEDEKKCQLADYIILNDGTTLVIPQVLNIHQLLLDLAKG